MSALINWFLQGDDVQKSLFPIGNFETQMHSASAVYPTWVRKHLTPELESITSSGVKNLNPLLGSSFDNPKNKQRITINDIFSWVLPDQETYQVQEHDLIHYCVSLVGIQFYEKYPYRVPSEWKGKLVYALKSCVTGSSDRERCAPCLDCTVEKPYVRWCYLYQYLGDGIIGFSSIEH